ncbi:MAG: GFA family protein [Myxococcales bacterium]|nr:hypothetical protein [Myxococcales bacterium]
MMRGRCHCGNISYELQTELAEPPLRACQCSFCRMHAARSISDPAGRLVFDVEDESLLSRYRFGLATADFLVCRRCGAYAGAFMDGYGIANARLLETALLREPSPVSYDGETAEQRIARRRERWTPGEIRIRAPRATSGS